MNNFESNPLYTGISIVAENVTSLSTQTIFYLNTFGKHYKSDKGDVVMQPRASLILTDPTQRSLNIPGRKSNIFQLIAETFWVASGSSRVTGYLSEFLPRAVNYSDDGVNWRGAYGGRLFEIDAYNRTRMDDIVDMLVESPMTRQAYVSIFESEYDLPAGLKKHYKLDSTKDVPCNLGMNFWVMPEDNTLNVEVFQRSGDIFWGTGSINFFEFSFILEMVLSAVNLKNKEQGKPLLKMGTYCQRVTNLHYYPDNIGKQVDDVVLNYQTTYNDNNDKDTMKLQDTSIFNMRGFSEDLLIYCEQNIMNLGTGGKLVEDSVDELSTEWSIEKSPSNTLYVYAKTVEQYLFNKHFGKNAPNFDVSIYSESPVLLQAIRDCKYTKFDI